MSDKKTWLVGTVLIALTSASVFAAGTPEGDADPAFGPQEGRVVDIEGENGDTPSDFGPYWGHRPFAEGDVEFDTYEGTFSMVDDRYPALETAEGEIFYLLPHFPMRADQVPADGSEISVRTLPCPMSPVHLEVFSAEVDGEALEPDWDAGGPGRGGFGMRGPGGPGMGAPAGSHHRGPRREMRGDGDRPPMMRGEPGMEDGPRRMRGDGPEQGGPGRFGASPEDEWRRRRPMWGRPIPGEEPFPEGQPTEGQPNFEAE